MAVCQTTIFSSLNASGAALFVPYLDCRSGLGAWWVNPLSSCRCCIQSSFTWHARLRSSHQLQRNRCHPAEYPTPTPLDIGPSVRFIRRLIRCERSSWTTSPTGFKLVTADPGLLQQADSAALSPRTDSAPKLSLHRLPIPVEKPYLQPLRSERDSPPQSARSRSTADSKGPKTRQNC